MKICFLADINSAHTRKWLKYFKETGNEVYVISLEDGEFEGVKVFSLGVDKSIAKKKSTLSKLSYLKNIIRIRKIVRDINPDILNAHYASSYGLLGSLCKYKPYILSVWGSDIYDFPNRSFIHKALIKYNLNRADYIFSTGNQMKCEISKYTSKEIYITPFGIDLDTFNGCKKEHKNITIGIAKSLEDIYGVDLLINVFAKLCENNNNILLKIAGNGTKENELKNLARKLGIDKRVKFLGYLNTEELVKFYQEIDVAVFPSRAESFGVAALEAQANRIPVVVSDAPGFKDTVINLETGFIVEKDNTLKFVERIDKLIIDKELREQMGERGRCFVEENYNIENNFNFISELFRKISDKTI